MGVLDDASEKTSAQAIIDAFNEVYPNIKITLDPISGNYTQGLLSRIKSGTVPIFCTWVTTPSPILRRKNCF